MKRYLLLQPLNPYSLRIKLSELKASIRTSGCDYLLATDAKGHPVVYVIANTPEKLSEFVTEYDIEGVVVEYTGVYDQVVTLE